MFKPFLGKRIKSVSAKKASYGPRNVSVLDKNDYREHLSTTCKETVWEKQYERRGIIPLSSLRHSASPKRLFSPKGSTADVSWRFPMSCTFWSSPCTLLQRSYNLSSGYQLESFSGCPCRSVSAKWWAILRHALTKALYLKYRCARYTAANASIELLLTSVFCRVVLFSSSQELCW